MFRAMFRVVRGDAFSAELADPATEQFRIRARDYRERLNLVFRRSDLRPAFLGTEVLALDGSVPLGLNKVTEMDMCVDKTNFMESLTVNCKWQPRLYILKKFKDTVIILLHFYYHS